ncbi:MAG: hypothetical protein WCI04_03210 [archaeon]
MKLNNVLLLTGIVLLILALTAFAHASVRSAPFLQLQNQDLSCTANLTDFIDLRNFTLDSNASALTYSIVSQSNPLVANCVIDRNYFVSCTKTGCANDSSTIVILAKDKFMHTSQDYFKLTLKQYSPEWSVVPSACINSSQSNLINLKNYVTDVEDGNNLTFALSSSSNSEIDCFINGGYFVSCNLSTNLQKTIVLDINAIDSAGKGTVKQVSISSNCYDSNGNDTNELGNGIVFEAENKGVCLEQCTSYATQVKVKNNSNVRKCFTFDAVSRPNYLPVSVYPNNVCINPSESTFLTLSSNTCGAQVGSYNVRLFAEDSNIELLFDYRVGTCQGFDGFSINESDGRVCQGEQKALTVNVRNTSSSTKKILLSAENSLILPYFDKPYVYLNSGEQKSVSLNINANNLPLGIQRITLTGIADNYSIEKSLTVDVVDCSDVVKRTLVLSVPNVCYDVRRGQNIESVLNITRQSPPGEDCYYTKKDFSISASGLPAELGYSVVSLFANESKAVPFTVLVPSNATAGKHYVFLTAADGTEWNSFKETKTICINVLGEQDLGFFVNTQSKDIVQGTTEVFEVEATNTGDFDSNYSLVLTAAPRGVTVSLSQNSFNLAKSNSKKIFVAISAGLLSDVLDNQRVILTLNGPISKTAFIYFNVKKKSFLDTLEILSVTKEIKMKGNSTAEYSILLRNNSAVDMRSVVVSFENVPMDVNIAGATIELIKSGKTATVSGIITAGDTNGKFYPVFVATNEGILNKKEFLLEISPNSISGLAGLFSAFFGFGEFTINSVFVSGSLAILLIVFVGLIIIAVSRSAKPSANRNEAWLK